LKTFITSALIPPAREHLAVGFFFDGKYDQYSNGNQSTEVRTPQARHESVGRSRRNSPLRARRLRLDSCRMIGTYFRWWGVYTQGDGAGVVGGQGGVGRALPFFMLRIRISNGLLRSDQLRTIANLTRRYARGTADLTVRQNIQLHWITIEALPEVLEELWRVGLNTIGACGDVTRNITGCPVAGVDADEICDASSLALEA